MRTHLTLTTYVLPLVIMLAACSGDPATPTGGNGNGAEPAPGAPMSTQSIAIVAELFYRERIALPPGAVAVAALEIAGSGNVVAETRDELADRSVPIPVKLELDRLQLPQDVGLVFRGSIEVDGVTAWRSEPQPVDLTSAAIELGPVLLRSVDPLVASLQAGTWVVEDILGGGIIDNSRVTLDFREQDVGGAGILQLLPGLLVAGRRPPVNCQCRGDHDGLSGSTHEPGAALSRRARLRRRRSIRRNGRPVPD